MRDDVVADIFNLVGEEFILLQQLKGDTVLHEDITDTLKQTKQRSRDDIAHKRISSMITRILR